MGKLISKQVKELRKTVVANLSERIARQYPGVSMSEAYMRLGREAGGISLSTIQRIMSGQTGPSIDTMAALCVPLSCTAADLTAPVVHPVRRERVRQYVDRIVDAALEPAK